MKQSVPAGTLANWMVAASAQVLAALFFLWVPSAYAAQTSAQFKVLINLDPRPCRSSAQMGAFGEVLIVECASGKIIALTGDTSNLPWTDKQDGSYRFIKHLSEPGLPSGLDDKYAAGGMVTSWHLVKLNDFEYLELMVGW